MRILFVSPTVGDAYGQERILNDSNTLLRAAGHETHFIAGATYGIPPASHSLTLLPNLFRWNTLSNPFSVASDIRELVKHLNAIQPDIVHWIDQLDFRIMEHVSALYPSVFTAHTVAPTCPSSQRFFPAGGGVCTQPSGWKCLSTHRQEGCLMHFKTHVHRLHALMEFHQKKRVLKKFSVIGAISPYIQHCLEQEGYSSRQIMPIYNSVSLTPQFTPESQKTSSPLLVVASRLVPLKGIGSLLLSLSDLRSLEWELWIFGDGPQRNDLEKLTHQLQLSSRVKFQGQRPLAEVHGAIRQARAFIQPNRGPEGFGLAVAEASLLGVPVIAYDVPALNFIIQNGSTGFLAPLHPETGLAVPLKTLLQNPELARQLGQAGADWIAKQFSPENHLKQTLAAYQKCQTNFQPSPTEKFGSARLDTQETS